jgi:ABC-type dipeptide/oligopeptide/nickel transport system permease component
MHFFRYVGRRLLLVVPQLFGIILVSFFLVKLIPGDPVVMMLGPVASQDSINALRESMGFNKPVAQQFVAYFSNVLHGDLGSSWQTTRPVVDDLLVRFPATLELVTFGLLLAMLIGVPLGIVSAQQRSGAVRRVADYYGLIVGAIPDFWLALVMVFVFYTLLHIVPAPLGRLGFDVTQPPTVTGSYLIDSLLVGDYDAFQSAVGHLILPVATLGFINAGPILKVTQSTMERILASDFIRYAEMCGLRRSTVTRQAIRNALPSVITIVSVLYGFLIGGAVLVEIVFSWGGAGQYAVQGVLNNDINPVLGFVLFAAVLSLIIYLVVDLIYFAIDPRMRA